MRYFQYYKNVRYSIVFETDWVKNIFSGEFSGRRMTVSFMFFFSGVMALSIMMPKLVCFSSTIKSTATPFQEQRFKVGIPLDTGEKNTVEAEPADNDEQDATSKPNALFHPIISRAAKQYQIDPDLVRAIIFAESGYNPKAVSKKGAMGLMQLMPGTAKAMGVEDCFDPEHNIFGGVKYFKKLYNQFDGDVKLALAAYNAGSRRVREFNGVPPFKATEHYIQKVMKHYRKYKDEQSGRVDLS